MLQGFGERKYRQWICTEDLVPFHVTVQETDLLLLARSDLSQYARQSVVRFRKTLEAYIKKFPGFQTALAPCDVPDDAPDMIREMALAAKQAGVGPFATVAGIIAEYVGKELLAYSPDVLVENGGDIFAASVRSRLFGVYAGHSPFSGKIALRIPPSQMPCGICTSAGTVGPSLSFGTADAVIVLASSTALADAWATALGNLVNDVSDMSHLLTRAERIPGIDGVVVVVGESIGAWGKIELVAI